MSLERNKELARAAIAIWSTGDLSRVLETFASRYVMHQHQHGGAGGEGDLQLAEGDLVATRFTSSGTHTGTFQGIGPTGRELSWTGMVIDRVQDDRIVESWGNWDMMGMLQQLGIVPTRPGSDGAINASYTTR